MAKLLNNVTMSEQQRAKRCNNFGQRPGYIALASVLVIAAVVLAIGISVSLLSINEAQLSLAGRKSQASIAFVDSCVEDALLRLNEDNSIPVQILLPAGSCDVTIDSQSGDDWQFTVFGSIDDYGKSIQVRVNRKAVLTITSWREVQ